MDLADELRTILPGDDVVTPQATWDLLRDRVTVLSLRAWEGRVEWPAVQAWLQNFDGSSGHEEETERLHALFLLSQFLYIGSRETRVLLQALYRDLFMIPLIQEVRRGLGGSRDGRLVDEGVREALGRTRFLGVGNPSESGVHLLYYFRQENGLDKRQFMDSAAIFANEQLPDGSVRRKLTQPDVERYVFVDDVCGSGRTAKDYSRNLLPEILALRPNARLHYLAMFATTAGLRAVREQTRFANECGAVFELDEGYKCLSEHARILQAAPRHIDGGILRDVVTSYGRRLLPKHPAGYGDGQLLLGLKPNQLLEGERLS